MNEAQASSPAVVLRLSAHLTVAAAAVPPQVRQTWRRELTLPNPAYVAARRQGRYSGHLSPSLSLYRERAGRILLPRGYTPRAVAHLRHAGLEVQVEDRRLLLPPVDFTFTGQLLPYQAAAVARVRTSGILCGPPGCGKTTMGLAVVAQLRQPTLWLTHTRDLAEQAAARAAQFLGLAADEIGRLGDGRWEPGPRFSVALVQSLLRHPDRTRQLARQVGLLVVDECHHVPALTFLRVVGRFPAGLRLGLTATPLRQDGLWPFAEATLGPVLHTITHDDLAAAGRLVRPRLVWVVTSFAADWDGDWAALLERLIHDPQRNRLIADRVLQEARAGHRVLVLTERVAHAALLAQSLERQLGPGRVALLTGTTPKPDRQEALTGLRRGRLAVLVATRLADEGLDLPELDRLFVVTPRRASAKVLQQAGRLMRPAAGKGEPILFDFRDRQVGVLEAQARHRWQSVYRHLVSGQAWEEVPG